MNIPCSPDHELEQRLSARLLDVFIRAGLVLVMTMLCYKIFSPFLALMIWALILAVTLYPIHRLLARMLGGKQGLAATLLILVGILLIVAPTTLLLVSGTADNVLKPLVLGRGVDAPMPVILLGAIGGMATTGILGKFIGATLLALGYQIFMWWVANNPESQPYVNDPQNAA